MGARHSNRSLKHYLQTASKITKPSLLTYNYKVLTASNGFALYAPRGKSREGSRYMPSILTN